MGELNHPVYVAGILRSEWKTGKGSALCWGTCHAYISTGKEKVWVLSKLIKIRHNREDLLMISAVDKKKTKVSDKLVMFDVKLCISTSETDWDIICLQPEKLPNSQTFYCMSPCHMAWMVVYTAVWYGIKLNSKERQLFTCSRIAGSNWIVECGHGIDVFTALCHNIPVHCL